MAISIHVPSSDIPHKQPTTQYKPILLQMKQARHFHVPSSSSDSQTIRKLPLFNFSFCAKMIFQSPEIDFSFCAKRFTVWRRTFREMKRNDKNKVVGVPYAAPTASWMCNARRRTTRTAIRPPTEKQICTNNSFLIILPPTKPLQHEKSHGQNHFGNRTDVPSRNVARRFQSHLPHHAR